MGGLERQKIANLRRQAEILLDRAPAVVAAEIRELVASCRPYIDKAQACSERRERELAETAAASVKAREQHHAEMAALAEAVRERKAAQQRAAVQSVNDPPTEAPDELLICRVIVSPPELSEEPLPEPAPAPSPRIERGDRTPIEIERDETRFHRRLDYPSLGTF
jgi:hypothetical protein